VKDSVEDGAEAKTPWDKLRAGPRRPAGRRYGCYVSALPFQLFDTQGLHGLDAGGAAGGDESGKGGESRED